MEFLFSDPRIISPYIALKGFVCFVWTVLKKPNIQALGMIFAFANCSGHKFYKINITQNKTWITKLRK